MRKNQILTRPVEFTEKCMYIYLLHAMYEQFNSVSFKYQPSVDRVSGNVSAVTRSRLDHYSVNILLLSLDVLANSVGDLLVSYRSTISDQSMMYCCGGTVT